jgi:hypothetical protein
MLTLISIKVSELTSTTSSTWDHLLLGQLHSLCMVLVTYHWHLPEVLLGSLILSCVAD